MNAFEVIYATCLMLNTKVSSTLSILTKGNGGRLTFTLYQMWYTDPPGIGFVPPINPGITLVILHEATLAQTSKNICQLIQVKYT